MVLSAKYHDQKNMADQKNVKESRKEPIAEYK